jgi:glycosyltransferase involved in cell wall biosynthesis
MPISDGLVALVSVIMPCRNAGVALRPALASVMAQTYPNLEIILVDDGLADGSRVMAQEMARACDRPLTITAAPTRGLNAARIHGLRMPVANMSNGWMRTMSSIVTRSRRKLPF